jgi:spore coat protein CotH
MKNWIVVVMTLSAALGQPQGGPPFGWPGGPGGPGGPPGMQEIKLLKKYDKNKDGWLNQEERAAARKAAAAQGWDRMAMGPGPGFGGEQARKITPGRKVTPAEVKQYGNEPLYDPAVLRTLFLEFENADWEKELEIFHNTDVDVPAKLTVDGKIYDKVGVRFRGMSSYMMVPAGQKRSLNLSLDLAVKDQRLLGHKTLNLLNSHQDPTFLRTVLYMQIARNYIPAPKANFARVVINGEFWGVYVSAEQFNTEFVQEWYQTSKGARWKVKGSPMGRGGLKYLGEDQAAYERIYELKSKRDPEAWAALARLTKVLTETPLDQLEAALAPMLDINGALRFLALEKTLINNDGYWARASDYHLYRDVTGKFHIIPHDANETLQPADGMAMMGAGGGPGGQRQGFGAGGFPGPPPGGFGPPRGEGQGRRPEGMPPMPAGNVKLDPFLGLDDKEKPLISRLLAVPTLRARYAGYVKEIATDWLDWQKLGPMATRYQALIAADVKADTRKLDSLEAFEQGLATDTKGERRGPGGGSGMSLKTFVQQRRAYLLALPEIAKAK